MLSAKERIFSRHHTPKVIPGDVMEVRLEILKDSNFKMIDKKYIKPIGWKEITEKGNIETHLLQKNKRHLCQMQMATE